MFIIAIIALIISSIFNSEMDTIKFRPQQAWFSGWWLENNWQNQPFWKKVPFSFLLDGWHLCKTVRIYTLVLPLAFLGCIQYEVCWQWGFLIAVPAYALHGIIFEIFYNN